MEFASVYKPQLSIYDASASIYNTNRSKVDQNRSKSIKVHQKNAQQRICFVYFEISCSVLLMEFESLLIGFILRSIIHDTKFDGILIESDGILRESDGIRRNSTESDGIRRNFDGNLTEFDGI